MKVGAGRIITSGHEPHTTLFSLAAWRLVPKGPLSGAVNHCTDDWARTSDPQIHNLVL
jgi:hypothetical protein